eukprot:jgi/Ulvmu1/12014/UM083_0027.1
MTTQEPTARRLVGHANFVRNNPLSDKFEIHRFHHIEFWTLDATSLCKRLQHGLGMQVVARSDLGSGNNICTSLVLRSGELTFIVTAPQSVANIQPSSTCPFPGYDCGIAFEFIKKHGLAVRAIGISVRDAAVAHEVSTANGGKSVLNPETVIDKASGKEVVMSEVHAYGDVVLRFVSGCCDRTHLPGFEAVKPEGVSFGLQRLDHCVGNVPELFAVADYLMAITGMHEFAEFTAEDVGTIESGLNSMVLANNNEYVLLPVNEPTFGTRRKSQIQTYLEFNEGAGVQHLALKTDDIFQTMRLMREQSAFGGMDFMPRSSEAYYRELPERIGNVLTDEQFKEVEELGVLVDKDDQGVLLQIFTKPIGDRPTLFFEIIQRVGCEKKEQVETSDGNVKEVTTQAGGCGGFGKGNFRELFKSIERYEDELCV